MDKKPEQHSRRKQRGVTQPKLILQVPKANAVLSPFPEKIRLAILPSLEYL